MRRPEHMAYLLAGLGHLNQNYVSLDASRPWLCYWIVHSIETIGSATQLPAEQVEEIVDFLRRCQHKLDGGFCGGPYPGQAAHLAPTYAAINALVTLGTEEAFRAIDRPSLHRFLLSMKRPDGGFCMHDDGECDVRRSGPDPPVGGSRGGCVRQVRGAYTAVAVASLCNVLDERLKTGTAEWIQRCQTYEGGIGATPGEEAHGGYTFCGLAAMVLLGGVHLLRLPQARLAPAVCDRRWPIGRATTYRDATSAPRVCRHSGAQYRDASQSSATHREPTRFPCVAED